MPSFNKFLCPVSEGVNNNVDIWSQAILFISSGIALLKLLNPASMCITGICIFAAAKAPAIVEFVSP